MATPLILVDAFADRAGRGNPAAVCLLEAPRPMAWMQATAREVNLPATAFVYVDREAPDLRWFSPTVELDFCGHGTLAAAHALWGTGRLHADRPAHFKTRAGRLIAERRGEWIVMDFPAEPAGPAEPPPELLGALDATPKWVGRNRFDYLVEVTDEAAVRALAPDLGVLATVPARGVIVTSAARGAYDFVSRFFAPRAGIPEDAVTGSAHCCLGPFWGSRLGKEDLTGYQASPRGGIVKVRLAAGNRVLLGGQAVTVSSSELV